MFTGIIEEIGKVLHISDNNIEVLSPVISADIHLGDSISVNGVCLTVCKLTDKGFVADISPETLRVTILGKLSKGSFVNLERALPVTGRLGGHIVSGHVDCIGKILKQEKNNNFYFLYIEIPKEQIKYIAQKGSITVNGISLTVANMQNNTIEIAIIPHTYQNTILQFSKVGDFVNIETDILAKYVEKFLSTSDNSSRVNADFLAQHGFLD